MNQNPKIDIYNKKLSTVNMAMPDLILLEKLKTWRQGKAQQERIELFRVLSNKTIEEIAQEKPKNKEELLKINGIKEKKFEKYGRELLALVGGSAGKEEVEKKIRQREEEKREEEMGEKEREEKIYSISDYLNLINYKIKDRAIVKGEITEIKDFPERSYLYFSLKDKKDESVLNCFMWRRDYVLLGIDLEKGLEIKAEGFSEIYKPNGGLTFKVSAIELVGEGILRKKYEELKKKLEAQGLFLEERKKSIPELAEKIGLITSEKGAVINDFLNNIGKFGFKISFFNSKVEGVSAAKEIISGIKYFQKQDIDVLVIIRGGGSLEALQAFNNEILVREIAGFGKPIICGIGHDKDIPLACLAADKSVSTPTAAAELLGSSWRKTIWEIDNLPRDIFSRFEKLILRKKSEILGPLKDIFGKYENVLSETKHLIKYFSKITFLKLSQAIKNQNVYLENAQKQLAIYDPINQLKKGYSLVINKGKIVKSVEQLKKKDEIEIKLSDGKIKSLVNDIIKE